jgi:hypothetical protein
VDRERAVSDCQQYRDYLSTFGDKCPRELLATLDKIEASLKA